MFDPSLFLLLAPLGALVVFGLMGDDGDDGAHDADDGTTPTDPQDPADVLALNKVMRPGDGDFIGRFFGTPLGDTLTASGDYQGRIEAGDGNDVLNMTNTPDPRPEWVLDSYLKTATATRTMEFGWQTDHDLIYTGKSVGGAGGLPTGRPDGLLEVLDQKGDDTITAAGSGIWLRVGEGNDVVNLTGLSHGAVDAGTGDIVTGSDVTRMADGAHALATILRGGGTYHGGDGDEAVYVHSLIQAERAVVNGGAGADKLASWVNSGTVGENWGSDLSGGDGNDTLLGNFNPFAADRATNPDSPFWEHVGKGNDRLDGGAGDDLIMFDHADTVTGGAGADTLTGYFGPEVAVDWANTTITLPTAQITDFNPDEDHATLNLSPYLVGKSLGNVTVTELDGNTLVQARGQTICVFQGQTDLVFAKSVEQSDGSFMIQALNGQPLTGDYDVLLQRHIAPGATAVSAATGAVAGGAGATPLAGANAGAIG